MEEEDIMLKKICVDDSYFQAMVCQIVEVANPTKNNENSKLELSRVVQSHNP